MSIKHPIPPLDGGTIITSRSDQIGLAEVLGTVDGVPFHLRSRQGYFVFGAGPEPENDPAFRLSRPHYPAPQDLRRPSNTDMDRALVVGVHQFRQHRRHHYQEAQRTKVLWCVNILGPNDVHAAENFEQAVVLCNRLNTFFSATNKPEHDILNLAIVARWPWGAMEHAEDLIETHQQFGAMGAG